MAGGLFLCTKYAQNVVSYYYIYVCFRPYSPFYCLYILSKRTRNADSIAFRVSFFALILFALKKRDQNETKIVS